MADAFTPNPTWFDQIMRTPKVRALVDGVAEETLADAKASAPVDTGAYRDGLHIEHRQGRSRETAMVVGSDEKTLLIESRTGNLARSVKRRRS
ncbi:MULTISPECIES: HK97 gp10 family phage protein [Bacteria]|uniref:HK97 gp10 family phage protein n=1 Tax=Microbacterium phage Min1 TaxID=446529 RepID=A6N203_9CAUD|nr:neck protein [Microbacterium phage Min1]ABR10475.1 hypothetical protein [Microbacterium phage Min1]